MTSRAQGLEIRVARDVVLHAADEPWYDGAGVLERGSHKVVPMTGLHRRGRPVVTAELPPARRVGLDSVDTRPCPDGAVFAGYLFAHFGHFLLESLSRLWLPALADAHLVWISATARELTPLMHEVLDELGMKGPRQVVIPGEPVAVDELAIPEAGFEVDRSLHPWLRRRLAIRRWEPELPARRVWLSRSALGEWDGAADQLELEAALSADGWSIVQPERLSFREQIDVIASSSRVAGIEGSALHLLVLVDGYGGTVDIFDRQGSRNFDLVATAAGLDQARHRIPGRAVRRRRPSGFLDTRWEDIDLAAMIATLRSAI